MKIDVDLVGLLPQSERPIDTPKKEQGFGGSPNAVPSAHGIGIAEISVATT